MTRATDIPAWIDGTLQPVDKLRAHREALRHKAVSVFVMRGGEMLIQRRAMGKYHTPGLWANTCCTHPHWQEAPRNCAVRRLEQELGITGLEPEYRHHLLYRADVGNGLTEHEEVDVFVAEASRDLALAPDPDEVMETRWIAYPDLLAEVASAPERFTPWIRIYLADHADTILGPRFASGG